MRFENRSNCISSIIENYFLPSCKISSSMSYVAASNCMLQISTTFSGIYETVDGFIASAWAALEMLFTKLYLGFVQNRIITG